MNAIKGLPLLSKDKPDIVAQIADVLVQLLNEDDNLELNIIRNALSSVVKIDVKSALKSLFKYIAANGPKQAEADPVIRAKTIQFLQDKVIPEFKTLVPLESSKEVESFVSSEVVKLLADCSEEEHGKFLNILNGIIKYEDAEGAKKFVQVVADSSPLKENDEFDPTKPQKLTKVLSEMAIILPHLPKTNSNQPYFNFIAQKVLPHFSALDDKVRNQVLRSMAVSSPFTPGSDARASLPFVYQLLVDGIPLPTGDTKPELNFSYLECILYTFHQLAQKVPGALNKICGIKIITGQPYDDMGDYKQKREDMITRLNYLETQSSAYLQRVNALKKVAAEKKKEESETEKKQVLLDTKQADFTKRVIQNLQKMSHPLSAKGNKQPNFLPPKAVDLSWITKAVKPNSQGTKRGPEQSSEEPPKKKVKELYKTPRQRGEEPTTPTEGKKGRGGRGGRGRGGRGGRSRK